MKILVSTPCFGGNLTDRYVGSALTAVEMFKNNHPGIEVHFAFEGKESLIHRGRDRMAKIFTDGGYDKLFTIDADIEFTYEDFRRIALSDKAIIGGTYPLKNFPIVMNFNPLPERGGEFFSTHRGFDYDAWTKFKERYADPDTGLAEVRHLPTGFMCVSRDVFAKLSEIVDVYATFSPESGCRTGYFHYYSSGVHNGSLESEDWSFSRRAREAGFPVYLDTKVTLGHMGTWVYRLGQFFGKSET